VEIVKAQPVAITSARDKMPFEVTPFYPRLSRYGAASAPAATTATAPTNDGLNCRRRQPGADQLRRLSS
jgi:hypothetical protein